MRSSDVAKNFVDVLLSFFNLVKCPVEGAVWLWSPFEYTIDGTKDNAGVQKDCAGPPREKFLNSGPPSLKPSPRYLNGPGKEGHFRAVYLGRQMLARRTGPHVLKECCPRLPGRAH